MRSDEDGRARLAREQAQEYRLCEKDTTRAANLDPGTRKAGQQHDDTLKEAKPEWTPAIVNNYIHLKLIIDQSNHNETGLSKTKSQHHHQEQAAKLIPDPSISTSI